MHHKSWFVKFFFFLHNPIRSRTNTTMTMYSALLISSLLILVVSIEGSHLPHLRTTGNGGGSEEINIRDDTDTPSNCNTVHDPDHCYSTIDTISHQNCVWCIAGAIPSECMSPQQASLLPPDVFDCATPGHNSKDEITTSSTTTTTTTTSKTKTSFPFESVVFGTTQIYSLVHDNHYDDHHNHNDVIVKKPISSPPQPSTSDLCDPSSKSLSGYMDISGSEYDNSGENKHLFYWFFEKRGMNEEEDVMSTTDSDTPVCVFFVCLFFVLLCSCQIIKYAHTRSFNFLFFCILMYSCYS
jgi:hypothetical protein